MTLLIKYWRPLAVLLLAGGLFVVGWFKGADHIQEKWDADTGRLASLAEQVKTHQAEATVQVVTEYVDKIKVVRERGATIIKEVVVYVPAQADTDCTINTGFVRLHDAAAGNTYPGPPGDTDAAPAGVALSAVASTVADNYGACHENAEQLMALQKWALDMRIAAKAVRP